MKIYFLFTLLFIMQNNDKQTKSEQDSGFDWISFLKFAAGNQYRYDFILDAVVDENRILTSYNNNDGYLIFKCKLK